MSGFVVDASIVMAWFFEDEATDQIDALLERASGSGAFAPPLLTYEVTNALATAERKRRVTAANIAQFLIVLDGLAIQIDGAASPAIAELLPLARSTGLTGYDAAYLDLAMRLGLPLATVDKELRHAAQKLGVAVLPPS